MTITRGMAVVATVVVGVAGSGCRQAAPIATEVVAVHVSALPSGPADRAWEQAPVHTAKLIPQDLVEPRQMKPTTPDVQVRAVTDGRTVTFRLEWIDDSLNNTPGPASMVDACAVQLPAQHGGEPPAPQMGEAGKPVEVTYWRADWQATIDGRGDSIRDLYPNAQVDHYPFEAKSLAPGSEAQHEVAKRYAPARALGNIRSGPRATPVEDLVASGPGTLAPVPSRGSNGRGTHAPGGWSVVVSRPWPSAVAAGQRTNIAVAVWQGSLHESGARKMRTGWIPLVARRQP